ncbi:MAG: MFS transporter [Leptospiraceae bacterium]|nr:MFS transporter [Leptospiraceae bacterium]
MSLNNFFKPAPHIEPLPSAEARRRYPALRWAALEATFIGYSSFYLVRLNLGNSAKSLETAFGIDNSMMGNLLAFTGIAYGLGKFLLGSVSDRSNVRRFMPFGLLLTALCNFAFAGVGSVGLPRETVFHLFTFIWSLNWFVQGMGWPPCGRTIGHWFSISERGLVFSVWNISHNIGGGLAGFLAGWAISSFGAWQYAFVLPGIMALIIALYLSLRLRDTPQSVGLPPIEEYRQDFPQGGEQSHEIELGTYDLFIKYVLTNRYLWLFAAANFFVYILRYSMLDWGPKFLADVKQADLHTGGFAQLVLEFSGIPSTILMGWLSDRVGGRRGMVSLFCILPILAAFLGLRANIDGPISIDYLLLGLIGFFVYPPVMLLGVAALDVSSKKAVGVAAGFVGLFGYLGKSAQGKLLGWMSIQPELGWDAVMLTVVLAGILAIALLALTWRIKPRG